MMASSRDLRTSYSENRCMDPGLGFPDLWLKLCNQENLMASIKKPIFVCFDLSVCKKLSGEPILMKVSNRLSDILRTVFWWVILMNHQTSLLEFILGQILNERSVIFTWQRNEEKWTVKSERFLAWIHIWVTFYES